MTPEEMKKRTKQYGLRIIRLVESLPSTKTAGVIGGQLLRSGTSTAANYRSACRATSPADFISKMGTVEEEADESLFWMEMSVEADIVPAGPLTNLMGEGEEILAIVVASIKTARNNRRGGR